MSTDTVPTTETVQNALNEGAQKRDQAAEFRTGQLTPEPTPEPELRNAAPPKQAATQGTTAIQPNEPTPNPSPEPPSVSDNANLAVPNSNQEAPTTRKRKRDADSTEEAQPNAKSHHAQTGEVDANQGDNDSERPIPSIESDGDHQLNDAKEISLDSLYKDATEHVLNLQKDPKSKAAAKSLKRINQQIESIQSGSENAEAEPPTIDVYELKSIYKKAQSPIEHLKKDPTDASARAKLEEYNKDLDTLIKEHGYPDWRIPFEVPAPASSGPAPANSGPAPASSEPAPANSGPATTNSEGSQQTPESQTISIPSEWGYVPPAVKAVQEETLKAWKSKGWSTYKTMENLIILSYQVMQTGKNGSRRYVLMKPEAPYFELMPGRKLAPQDRNAYLDLPNKHEMVTGLKGPYQPSSEKELKFKSLLWVAPLEAKRQIIIRCCCIWDDNSITIPTRTQFREFEEDRTITSCCIKAGLPVPSNIKDQCGSPRNSPARSRESNADSDQTQTRSNSTRSSSAGESVSSSDEVQTLKNDIDELKRVVRELSQNRAGS